MFNSAFKQSFSEDSELTEHPPINSPLSGYDSEYSIMNITDNISLAAAADAEENEQDNNNNEDNNSNDSEIIN